MMIILICNVPSWPWSVMTSRFSFLTDIHSPVVTFLFSPCEGERSLSNRPLHTLRLNRQKVEYMLSLSHPMHHQQSQRHGPTFCLLSLNFDTRVTYFVGMYACFHTGWLPMLTSPFFCISHKQCERPQPMLRSLQMPRSANHAVSSKKTDTFASNKTRVVP